MFSLVFCDFPPKAPQKLIDLFCIQLFNGASEKYNDCRERKNSILKDCYYVNAPAGLHSRARFVVRCYIHVNSALMNYLYSLPINKAVMYCMCILYLYSS